MKKVAIMQPYLFPYLGYFQLVKASDVFVFYNDVAFIKQGWINRNFILNNGKKQLFSVPVQDISSHKKINETKIDTSKYDWWKNKFFKTLQNSYGKAPYYDVIMDQVIQPTIHGVFVTVEGLAQKSICITSNFLGIETDFLSSSADFNETMKLPNLDRMVKICHDLQADQYINPIGGLELYNKEEFNLNNLELFFIETDSAIHYKQFENPFLPNLSIIDVLMFNSKNEVQELLYKYKLV